MNILLFAGYSASGKSTLAEGINKILGYKLLDERAIIHDLAVKKGYSRSRHWLESEGLNCLVEAARSETIQNIRESQDCKGVIIDGAYDREIPEVINSVFPEARLTIINIIAERDVRKNRMELRLGSLADQALFELEGIDCFKREAGVEEIMSRADITIDNSTPLETTLAVLHRELGQRGLA